MCVIPVVTSIKEEEKLIQSSTKVHTEHHCYLSLQHQVRLSFLKRCVFDYSFSVSVALVIFIVTAETCQ